MRFPLCPTGPTRLAMRRGIFFFGIFTLILVSVTALSSVAQTVCVFDANGNRVLHSIVEFWDAQSGYQKYNTGAAHCVDQAGITAVEELPDNLDGSRLSSYPNPAGSKTIIRLTVDRDVTGTLYVYDLLGRRVLTGARSQFLTAGVHETTASLLKISSGYYLTRFEMTDGESITGSFLKLGGSYLTQTGSIEPLQTIQMYEPVPGAETMIAIGKNSGADSVRVTSPGKRQQTLTVDAGADRVAVFMQPGHTVLMHVREMTNHYHQLIGGEVIFKEGRSGLEQRIQITENVTEIVVSSDSTLWQYTDQEHDKGRFSIQPIAPVNSRLKTSTDVYTNPAAFVTPLYTNEKPMGPWYMSPERYEQAESVAILFAMKDSFDLERYFNEVKNSFYTPIESGPNMVIGYNHDEYKLGLTEAEVLAGNRTLPYYFEGIQRPSAIRDSITAAFSTMVPTAYDNTFLTVRPVEGQVDDLFSIVIHYDRPTSFVPGVYFTVTNFQDALLIWSGLFYDNTQVYNLHDYALVFAAMESVLDDTNLPFEFVQTDEHGNHINEFTEALKEYKAVQYGLGQMVVSGTPAAPVYIPGTYEIRPDEIRGGFMSLNGDTGAGKRAYAPSRNASIRKVYATQDVRGSGTHQN